MKNMKKLIVLGAISGILRADFSPELIQLKKDIEILNQNSDTQLSEMVQQLEAVNTSMEKEEERIDQEITKKMMQIQKYWPEVKKELDGLCNGCTQKGILAPSCKECADLISMMFESLKYVPNNQLLLALRPYADKYLIPQISAMIQTESHLSKEEADSKAQKKFDAVLTSE